MESRAEAEPLAVENDESRIELAGSSINRVASGFPKADSTRRNVEAVKAYAAHMKTHRKPTTKPTAKTAEKV